ncbi:recombinase family protein [Flavobacterium cerinum]|uniref:Recombinase family protein n=1 Tax=Flavobacterium cerinum TaxID=2502784 RepID=A0ABY5IX74_9FLAO|nr:recombinase family protein [Flavobacterium cerinum]UUC47415.1 recombinase family protein [Flavobacterium cerinum]
MKIADLYIRVSTDEQADKGYSQRDQEERLRNYCNINGIKVRKVLYEDHSAKTFIRPAWTSLLNDLKKHRGQSDLVLFTKWDRFSRNTSDAYMMISRLRTLGVDPQAVEQPLDMSIPESKMMLAFYLAAPEVENDRRALNVFYGMRRAKKEGRVMGIAPIGYCNKVSETGKKYIAVREDEAEIIRWIFKEISLGRLNSEQIWKMSKEKGLKCSKNSFWVSIRNPVYCGKVFVPKYKDEEAQLVQGQHEPLITESLFYDVQDILDGRKKVFRTTANVNNSELPLRGHLICPLCGKLLTGSASKGRSNYYYYYHCRLGCKFREKATEINDKFIEELKRYVKPLPVLKLYKETIVLAYQNRTKNNRSDIHLIKTQLKESENRISKARDMLLEGHLEPDDYKKIKTEGEEKIRRLEASLTSANESVPNIKPLLESAISNISGLDVLYEKASIERKRKIIGSIFPENLTFVGSEVRTVRVNEALRLMLLLSSELGGKKNGANLSVLDLPQDVTTEGFEPPTLRAEI